MVIQVDLATAMDRSSRTHQVVEKVVLGSFEGPVELYGKTLVFPFFLMQNLHPPIGGGFLS